jgi:predicted acylesterase/phospholipase RssA
MSPSKRTTSGKGSKSRSRVSALKARQERARGASDDSGVATAIELFEAIQEWAARDPDAAREAIELIRERAEGGPGPAYDAGGPKRAICLGGGGPAVGLHIGALEGLKHCGVDFGNARSVWALSCIGAWAGVIYNQAEKGREIEETYNFFLDVFRDDKSFQSFPTNTIFAPDWAGYVEAILEHLWELDNYRNAFLPRHLLRSYMNTASFLARRKNWRKFSEGDFNRWTLNHVLAMHPAVRFLTGLVYKTKVDGRARLYYEDSTMLKGIDFAALKRHGKPFIFYNAFNLGSKDIDLFANDPLGWTGERHAAISAASLCACSALPFVEETVTVDGTVYCEGALVDTINFRKLLEDHHSKDDPLEEIWINRIVDAHQIHKPENLHDALANLCQLFAATVGEDDIKLFKYHVQENNQSATPELKKLKWTGTIIEIEVNDQINFHWSHKNLKDGRTYGAQAAADACHLYKTYKHRKKKDELFLIPDHLSDEDIVAAGVKLSPRRQRLREARLRAGG